MTELLDIEAKKALEMLKGFSAAKRDVAELRRARRRMAEEMEREEVDAVEDITVSGPGGRLTVRLYWPRGMPRGILVYLHGGGWIAGDLETHDGCCRALAHATPCVVASVEYRLAPEHRFPAAVEDAYAATEWAWENRSALLCADSKVAVGGDSAGGNLAAVVSLKAREEGRFAVAHQLLVYPVTDTRMDTESYRRYGDGYFLTRKDMEWYLAMYLGDVREGESPYVSVLRAPNLEGVAPATIIVAECDVLRDEGELYARRLWESGVEATLVRFGGMIHGFFALPWTKRARRCAVEIAAAELRAAFES